MKRLFLIIAMALSLFSLPATAVHPQSDNECLVNFTHSYFDWFRGVLRSSYGGSLKEMVQGEMEEATDLLHLLKNTSTESCPKKTLTQMRDLRSVAKSWIGELKQLAGRIKAGEVKYPPDSFITARTAYRKYHVELIKALRYETGIRW